jgi:hypothetical protein
MSRPTASPPPNKASGPNGYHRASQATTTSVKRYHRAARASRSCWARTAQERVVSVVLEARRPTNPHSNPLEVHCDADAVRSVPRV